MDKRTITLRCLRDDGSIESTKLERLSLEQAHQMAERILQIGRGLYTEVKICTESGNIETIRKGETAAGAAS